MCFYQGVLIVYGGKLLHAENKSQKKRLLYTTIFCQYIWMTFETLVWKKALKPQIFVHNAWNINQIVVGAY